MTTTLETNIQKHDMTTNLFHVEKPLNGSNATIALSSEAPTEFEFGLADISGFQILDGGALMISFIEGDEALIIENYSAIVETGQFQEISLNDGEVINLGKLAEGLSPSSSTQVADNVLADDLAGIEPAAGDKLATLITKSNEYTLVAGETYQTDFNQSEVANTQVNDNGDLVITFVDETETTIIGFKEIESAEDIPTMTLADGTIINVKDLLATATAVETFVEEVAQQPTPSKPVQIIIEEEIAQVRPEDFASIEPAAGDTNPAGALGNTGANFGSSVSDIGLGNVDAVGPIGVTNLAFDRPEFEEDDVFFSQASGNSVPPVVTAFSASGYEDQAINFGISAQSSDPQECIDVVVSGIPAGWTPDLTNSTTTSGTYDSVAGTWTLTLGVGETLTSGPVFIPPLNSDLDISSLTVNVTQKDPANGNVVTGTTSTSFAVAVDAVADPIDLVANDVVGTEDTSVLLDLSATLQDLDGSEEITEILICNVPAGFTLSAGTEVSPGNWAVSQSGLATLELTSPANYSGTVSLEIKVTNEEVNFSDAEFDFTNNENITTLPFDVTFTPVADTPVLVVGDAQVKEDGNVDLPINAQLVDPSETLTIRVENLDTTWGVSIGTNNGVYNSTTGVWEITLNAGENYDGVINLTPPADSDLDMTDVVVTAISTESDNSTAETSETIDIVTDAVADIPDLNAGADQAGQAGQSVALNIMNDVTDNDGSESLGNVTISGVPTDYTLTAGSEVSPGVWEVAQADLVGLQMNIPANASVGSFDLTVSVTSTDTPTDTEYDFTDNQATNTDTVTITVNPDRDPPEISFGTNGSGEGRVYEDGSIFIPITGSLNGVSSQILTVEVSGIPSTWTIGNTDGTYNSTTGTWTITMPEGQDYNGGLTFTPPADSDVDLTGLTVTATSTLVSDNSTSSTEVDGAVIVDAVADTPIINAGTNQTVVAGNAVAINITNDTTDVDNSESLGVVTVSGVPTGYTLTAGTEVSPGVWEIAQTDLAGLQMNVPANATGGDVVLTVSVTSTESITDTDFDLTNNTATNTDTVTITVDLDDQPKVVNAYENVDETNLVSGVIVETGSVSADFGADGPGTFEIDGRFVASDALDNGVLTHNGVPIVVTTVGNTYYGRAGAVDVFTLEVNSDGSYEFNLIENLDHSEPNQANENINLEFGFDAIDSDGDRTDGIIAINVKDDVPSITTEFTPIDEDGLKTSNVITLTDTITHSYGQDGAGSINPTGNFTAKFEMTGPDVTLTSNGVVIVVTATATGYVGMAGADTIFDLTVNDNGEYTYNQYEGIDHPDANDPDDVMWLKFEVQITDFDGDTKTAVIGIDVHDSSPVAIDDNASVAEDETITGNVITNDIVGADDPAIITMVNGQNIGVNGLTVVGAYGTLVIQQDGSYEYTANSNNPDGVDSFAYKLSDADGDTDLGVLSITVTSTNDVPVAKADVVTMWSCDWSTIGNVMTGYNQKNDGADTLSADGGNQVQSIRINGVTHAFKDGGDVMVAKMTYGTIIMFKDGTYSYFSHQSSPQDSQTENLTYTIEDADGDTSSASLQILVKEAPSTANQASDYGNQTQGTNTVIDGEAAYKTDDTDGAQVFGYTTDDVLSGNVGNDALYGYDGEDKLYGDAGNDVLYGARSNNILEGGEGSDLFVIHSDKALNNNLFDTVVDFDIDEGDVLSLSSVIAGFDSTDDINDFVRISFEGDTAVVQVDSYGTGTNYHDVAKIQSHADLDATTLNVQDLFDQGHIDVY